MTGMPSMTILVSEGRMALPQAQDLSLKLHVVGLTELLHYTAILDINMTSVYKR